MHVHGTQMNQQAAVNAVEAAQRVAAKREAEGVRKELVESASELAAESELSEAYVVTLRRDSRRQSKRRNQQNQQQAQQDQQQEQSDAEESDQHISGWA